MTLAEMRELVYLFSSDKYRQTDTARVDQMVNLATQHVGSWVATNMPHLMLTDWAGAVENPESKPYVIVSPSVYPKSPVRKVVGAYRADVADDSGDCEIIDFFQARAKRQNSLRDNPPVFNYGGNLGFLEPKNGIAMHVQYVRNMGMMLADAAEPIGLPETFQVLIPTYATLLKLTAERLDAEQWRTLYAEQKQQLLAAVGSSRVPQRG